MAVTHEEKYGHFCTAPKPEALPTPSPRLLAPKASALPVPRFFQIKKSVFPEFRMA